MRPLTGIDEYVEQVREGWSNVGVAIAVVHGEDLLYARGFGHRQMDVPDAVDADTLFQVGSVTKPFTATALGLLVDAGVMQWDDPVVRHFPGLELRDPWVRQHLTIADVLSHRSGLGGSYYPFVSVMSPDDAIDQLRHLNPVSRFRDSFEYSNLLYGLAGKLVQVTSGRTWQEFVQQELLRPLRMDRSRPSPYDVWDSGKVTGTFIGTAPDGVPDGREARVANVAMPHGWDDSESLTVLPWQSYDNAAAAGSLVSSASDIAQWMMLHLNAGTAKGRALLSPGTVRRLHAVHNVHAGSADALFPLDGCTEGYALGWWRALYRGHTHLHHSGGILGFPAFVALLPDDGLGVAVLSNGPGLPYLFHRAIVYRIFDTLLDLERIDWNSEFLEFHWKQQELRRRRAQDIRDARLIRDDASLPLVRYAGRYEDREAHSGPVLVGLEEGRLMLRFSGVGALAAELTHWHGNTFRMRLDLGPRILFDDAFDDDGEPLTFVSFRVGSSGSVNSMSALGSDFLRLEDIPAQDS